MTVTQKHPEKSHNNACMNSREDDKGSGSLLEKEAHSEELKEESKRVIGKAGAKFDTTWNCI